MSNNEYNENRNPKDLSSDAEDKAAMDALNALGGSTVDKSATKKSKKKIVTEETSSSENSATGKNKYLTEEEKSASASKPKTEKKSAEKKERTSNARTFVQIMNGEILTKDTVLNNLPFTFFIGLLFIVLIAWGYYAETITKKEIQLEKDLGELNSEFFTLTADYNMQRGRRQIANRLEHTGVKESQTSPYKIRVRKYVFN